MPTSSWTNFTNIFVFIFSGCSDKSIIKEFRIRTSEKGLKHYEIYKVYKENKWKVYKASFYFSFFVYQFSLNKHHLVHNIADTTLKILREIHIDT